VRVVVLVLVLGGALLGFLLRTFREARATPNDKAACDSALLAIKTFGEQSSGLIPAVSKADDEPIREMAPRLAADISNRDEAGLVNDVNELIHRCGQISSNFRNEFNDFCEAHKEQCVKR
jgi:hypothetical protein